LVLVVACRGSRKELVRAEGPALIDVVPEELYDHVEFALTQYWLDRSNDPGRPLRVIRSPTSSARSRVIRPVAITSSPRRNS